MSFIKKLFSKAKKSNDEMDSIQSDNLSHLSYDEIAGKQVSYDTTQSAINSIEDNCGQIVETSRQLEDMKVEYQAVTSYLADIQRIELMPKDQREELNHAARRILALSKDREKFQNQTKKLTEEQCKHISQYEDIMPAELKKMMKNETYNSTIKKDMHYLEGEKGALSYQKEETLENQDFLKRIGIIMCFMVTSLFVIFIMITMMMEADMILPFLLTVVLALVSAIYIFSKSNSNRQNLIIVEAKLNKAISLLNKVKIKYVNSTSELDYTYQKYMVNSYAELNYLWELYLKEKEEQRHYKKSSIELESYHEELIRLLKHHEVADPEIWMYQAEAILDEKEMTELKHRLNTRRQKLRKRIDYNNNLKEHSINEIIKYMNKKPDYQEEVRKILNKYKIEL